MISRGPLSNSHDYVKEQLKFAVTPIKQLNSHIFFSIKNEMLAFRH